jgi:aminopeptidase N
MQLWTKQTGYPVVQVLKSINSNNEVILKLSQRRFLVNGSIPDETEDYLWKIPIKILTKTSYPNVYKEFLFERRNDEINIGHINEFDWIKLNKNSIGIYRTQYSTEMLFALIEPVKRKILHATDRLGLQDDVFNLVNFKSF